jgi:protein-disulfide isomerase
MSETVGGAQSVGEVRKVSSVSVGSRIGALLGLVVACCLVAGCGNAGAVSGGRSKQAAGASVTAIGVPSPSPSQRTVVSRALPASPTRNAVDSELEGIPQAGNVLGEHEAPVTLQYFADLECPICRAFNLGALPQLIRGEVRSGKLRIEYRSLETATREPRVFKAQQIAALAAGRQDKLWYFVELFYHEQGEEDSGYVNESYLQRLARQVPGLNLPRWDADRNEPSLAAQVNRDAQFSDREGFTGTPSFLIGRTGGPFRELEYSSLESSGSFEAAINRLLGSR